MKKTDIDWLYNKLNEHLGVHGGTFSEEDSIYFYSKLNRNLLYEGDGYRILEDKMNSESVSKNLCWSKTLNGISYYFQSVYNDSDHHIDFMEYNLYKAEIQGLDVNKIISWLESIGYNITSQYVREEEVIVCSINNIRKINTNEIPMI